MTAEIRLQIASLEHMSKQPAGLRYALFCDETLKNVYEVDCATRRTLGHIEDFGEYGEAKQLGIDHPHAVLIRYYPDSFESRPADDFIQDLKNQPVRD